MKPRPTYTIDHKCYRCGGDFRTKDLWPVGTRMKCDKCRGRHAKKSRPIDAARQLDRGVVSLAAICRELHINPKDARRILRRKYDKPIGGWSFTREETERIKRLLREQT